MDVSGTLTASQDVLSREIQGETVLLDLKTDSYFGLKGVGARIWQLLNAGTSVADTTAVLAAEFDVSEDTLAKDVERFVGELVKSGLVTPKAN
jgi:hypothetical protein